VAIPTNETNSSRTASKSNHCKWAEDHLTKNAEEVSREKLAEVKEQASQLLHGKAEPRVLSNKEESFVKQTIESNAMSSPKQLFKDHQNPDTEGNFPAGLTVPATNFASAFPKTGHLLIKRIPDDNEVDNMSKTMIQASDLKENLECQGIACNGSTTVSADAADFCPSARLKPVRKAVYHFSKNLSEKIKSPPNTAWT